MTLPELSHIKMLAEVDSLLARLQQWGDQAPDWPPAKSCQALVRRLVERAEALKERLEAPLVVATLGGTGTGKSTLVNALAGDDVTAAGRQRPTTLQPIFVARPGLSPATVGVDPATVYVVERELPNLRHLVLIDCPDPDTTEAELAGGQSNLSRLREILPHCDVLLVASTQQKYRSNRVLEELAGAAAGVHLVFVQTHADTDSDIRDDWRAALGPGIAAGEMFFVDSVGALANARRGAAPPGEFARLVELLTTRLVGAAAERIRRANFIDLCRATLAACRELVDRAQPALAALDGALDEQRRKLAAKLATRMRDDLIACRRQWEQRLVAEVASHWGTSPFALAVRAWQGIGGLATSALLLRVRTPAQLAMWGALEGGRRLQHRRKQREADDTSTRATAWEFDPADLRAAGLIVEGFANDAGFPRDAQRQAHLAEQAGEAAESLALDATGQVQALVARLAQRHEGTRTRLPYEIALGAMLGMLLFRLGWNFFYASWLAPTPEPLYDLKFYAHAIFWLLLWCGLLLWLFSARLRRGLDGEISRLAQQWVTPATTSSLFAGVERQAQSARDFLAQLGRLEAEVTSLQQKLDTPDARLGHRAG